MRKARQTMDFEAEATVSLALTDPGVCVKARQTMDFEAEATV